MNSKILILSLSLLALSGCNSSGSKKVVPESNIIREDIEWLDVWLPHSNEHDLPHILLIGNSITRDYYPKVETQLNNKAYVGRLSTSKSIGDPALLSEVALILSYDNYEIIHFNNGMHGWGYTEDEYEKCFPDLIRTIKEHAPDAKLIWASTTPVRMGDGMAEFDPKTERVRVRNQIAEKEVKNHDIIINDLFGFVEHHPEYYAGGDGTHLVAEGVTAMSEQVASVILKVLEEEKSKK